MNYPEDALLPISGLQHLAFCPRQCALIHLERTWAENFLTASGRVMHERVHNAPSESRGDVRTARGLALRSLRLGLAGVADVVEFHRVDIESDAMNVPKSKEDSSPDERPAAVPLPKKRGLWRPYPVEYKRGNPKRGNCDAVQLCAQAICLEEMLDCFIPEGSLFYGLTRRREIVPLDETLRWETEQMARDFHALIDSGQTPPPDIGPKCKACSLADDCLPGMRSSVVMNYLRDQWKEAESGL